MIIIKNISKNYSKIKKQHYVLRVNDEELVEFDHTAKDGLPVCLRKAAEAYEQSHNSKRGK